MGRLRKAGRRSSETTRRRSPPLICAWFRPRPLSDCSRFWSLGHGRRQLLWFEVTRHPTAEWLARQITEAFPWASAPAYLVRDNDRAYGHAFRSRVRAMGIRDRPISPGSPWQNAYVERLIGTMRRECLLKRTEIVGCYLPYLWRLTMAAGTRCSKPWSVRLAAGTDFCH
jgi:transposase InsO family protein